MSTPTGTGPTLHVQENQERKKCKPGEPQNAETSQDTLLALQQTSSGGENEEGMQIKRGSLSRKTDASLSCEHRLDPTRHKGSYCKTERGNQENLLLGQLI